MAESRHMVDQYPAALGELPPHSHFGIKDQLQGSAAAAGGRDKLVAFTALHSRVWPGGLLEREILTTIVSIPYRYGQTTRFKARSII